MLLKGKNFIYLEKVTPDCDKAQNKHSKNTEEPSFHK